MTVDKTKKTIVIGHKNPDTDSICSAICYANLKQITTGGEYVPGRAGHVNSETQFVLDYFGMAAPKETLTVKTQVKDIDIRETKGVAKNISLKKAWNLMQDAGVVTIPAVTEDNVLEGLITVGDITRSYMNVYDSSILSKACTQYTNIIETLEGAMLIGDEKEYFKEGKVLIAAANPDMMEYYIEKNDLVILGNRYESQLCAIEMEASCIIVCEGAGVSMTIKKLAQERGCTVVTTPYDTYTAARLINQSMPISFFMKTENLITFDTDDYIDDIKEVMASKRHRDFPILDKNGKYKGMISRRNLLGARGKNVILVDHNERSQAVDGIENANILEIIDHHRLGTVETMGPVFFRNQPLGCTATIIYQMYKEAGVTIEKKIAGLLCSAIISDTLLFRSPTCTPVDKDAALKLAAIAEIDVEQHANKMFAAGSKLKGKSDAEIFYQDFKRFTAGKISFGVGQITSLNSGELDELKDRMLSYMDRAREDEKVDMMFFMLTNILTESTELICDGQGAEQLAADAFHIGEGERDTERHIVSLPGVVSRKKQLVPGLMVATEQ
ncbi:putative manganese-dependent inorganic diphosphatase [[Clostridium] symbiosum]|uniref:putative manganese-dependent inorganic diphosphatase n=1 Tax=Clostridium symbiosum TaxID=1512 RepID=UPI001D06B173|nr:putative manganese-dependent inorganic diphosphatase [[Clostridium] symbiosum]MCB6610326.1 putative manganese-dependent inorganic diphosphatase [[Clostridium] symbiosum]MCB6932381.1 putative manganese-dependent inorganic diphosphatase [[Clostridium] symbiosum]